HGERAEGEPLPASLSLRDALSGFMAQRRTVLPVADDAGAPYGALHFSDLLREEPLNVSVS
ncbi:MAG: ABC transporter ATP-binding protein, partial [Kluyvera sp.]